MSNTKERLNNPKMTNLLAPLSAEGAEQQLLGHISFRSFSSHDNTSGGLSTAADNGETFQVNFPKKAGLKPYFIRATSSPKPVIKPLRRPI
ncbi:uncharacterized protein FOBCDRAFT_140282 [Fusarium oxysporum Fo47]|uniref:uncharacterized protein n=1 Tax=Fusarium oxysporum Fo47 TaxID=660027 RepID=UPI00286981AC|nr:uncharacterized protein FOBCDRAFT_140282 [Fusarium oxysporum Fo47]WJG35804.1 hypothetical protein FOBCDRAFT_140282 [Fusarium oxysporum Fo47]